MPRKVVVSLSVHKNTRAQRRAKELARGLRDTVAQTQETFGRDFAGYCVVAWNKDGAARTFWDGIGALGGCPMPEYVHHILNRRYGIKDALRALDVDADTED